VRGVLNLIRAVMKVVMVGRRKGSRRGTWQEGNGGREIEVDDEERVWIYDRRGRAKGVSGWRRIFDRFRRRESTGGILGRSWEMELVLWDFMMMVV
jgi:hypothetical protein